MPTRQDLLPYEQHIQTFLAQRGTHDVDSQAAVFNLDHASMDVLATMEGIALRPHELTHAGFVLLMTLWITGPRETRELASVLRVTKGAIVGAVNTLERRNFVRRIRSETDRRLVTVELTEEGNALISRVQRDWHELEREVTDDLTIEEKQTLAALCRKLAHSARNLRHRRGSRLPELPDPARFLGNPNGDDAPRPTPPQRIKEILGNTATPPALRLSAAADAQDRPGLRPSALPVLRHQDGSAKRTDGHDEVRLEDNAPMNRTAISRKGDPRKKKVAVSLKAEPPKYM